MVMKEMRRASEDAKSTFLKEVTFETGGSVSNFCI